MSGRIPTILIDANCLFREGLGRLLAETSFEIIASIDRPEQVVDIADDLPSGETLFIMDCGGEPSTTSDHVRVLKHRRPRDRILILSERYTPEHMAAAVRAGADGYLLKTIGYAALVKSLELVMLGVPVLPPAARDLVTELGQRPRPATPSSTPPRELTEREIQVIQCLVRGESNKTIARKLDVAEATVKVHIKAILRKIRVSNRTQAAIWALDHDIAGDVGDGGSEGLTREEPLGPERGRKGDRIVPLKPSGKRGR